MGSEGKREGECRVSTLLWLLTVNGNAAYFQLLFVFGSPFMRRRNELQPEAGKERGQQTGTG